MSEFLPKVLDAKRAVAETQSVLLKCQHRTSEIASEIASARAHDAVETQNEDVRAGQEFWTAIR